MVSILCECKVRLSVPDTVVGKVARCSRCKRILRFVSAGGAGGAGDFVLRLLIEAGPARAGELVFVGGGGPITVGKSQDRLLVLQGSRVAPNHCTLSPEPSGAWRVRDEASASGLFVNDVRVAEQDLADGDLLRVGEYYLRFFDTAAQRRAAAGSAVATMPPAVATMNSGVAMAGPAFGAAGAPATPRASSVAPPKPALTASPAVASVRPPAAVVPRGPAVSAGAALAPRAPEQGQGSNASPPREKGMGIGLDDDEVIRFRDDEEEAPPVPPPATKPPAVAPSAARSESAPPRNAPRAEPPPGDDALYDIIEEPPPRSRSTPTTQAGLAAIPRGGGPACPSCGKTLPFGAKICIACGIDIKSGRPLVTSHGVDENSLYANTDGVVKLLSWVIPFGFAPIASEAYGKHKPYAIWAIAGLTVVIHLLVFVASLSGAHDDFGPAKDFMLWSGDRPNARLIRTAYADGDDAATRAFNAQVGEIIAKGKGDKGPNKASSPELVPADGSRVNGDDEGSLAYKSERVSPAGSADEEASGGVSPWLLPDRIVVEAYESLPPEHRKLGEFHYYQLLTNAFLHAGFMHLAGNLVFLLVFGSRINALAGQWMATALYIALAVLASTAHLISSMGQPVVPALGASGAIMGMAGMYFVLFPVNRVFMVIWLRLGLFTGFRRLMKIWPVRGFWVLLFYIAFDVFATLTGSKDGTAHWAHLGGFIAGMLLALALLFTRVLDPRGSDLVSLLLGKHAWKLLGRPTDRKPEEPASVLAERTVDMNYR